MQGRHRAGLIGTWRSAADDVARRRILQRYGGHPAGEHGSPDRGFARDAVVKNAQGAAVAHYMAREIDREIGTTARGQRERRDRALFSEHRARAAEQPLQPEYEVD